MNLWTAIPLTLLYLGCSVVESSAQDTGVWIAFDGKKQFMLKDAKRIPTGKLVTITGEPLPTPLPRVSILNPTTGEKKVLEVYGNPAEKRWFAPLPQLAPNLQTQILIDYFKAPGERDVEVIRVTFVSMMWSLYDGAARSALPEDDLATRFSEGVKSLLTARFNPDTTLAKFVLLRNGVPTGRTLGAEVIEVIGNSTNRATLNYPAKALNALNDLREIFEAAESTNVELPDSGIAAIRSYVSRIDKRLFQKGRGLWIRRLIDANAGLLPMPNRVAVALRDFLKTGQMDLNEEQREVAASAMRLLATPLEEYHAEIFRNVMVVARTSYETSTLPFAVSVSDLSRYGTIDYIQGYIPPTKEVRGFLTFSFYPTGPEERTPEDVTSSWSLSAGYSVTGGGDSPEGLFLLGTTIRLNRFVSLTVAAVTAGKGGPWLGLVGVAGDISAIPFLNDIFAVRTE
jgi:hypothetical protein